MPLSIRKTPFLAVDTTTGRLPLGFALYRQVDQVVLHPHHALLLYQTLIAIRIFRRIPPKRPLLPRYAREKSASKRTISQTARRDTTDDNYAGTSEAVGRRSIPSTFPVRHTQCCSRFPRLRRSHFVRDGRATKYNIVAHDGHRFRRWHGQRVPAGPWEPTQPGCLGSRVTTGDGKDWSILAHS